MREPDTLAYLDVRIRHAMHHIDRALDNRDRRRFETVRQLWMELRNRRARLLAQDTQ